MLAAAGGVMAGLLLGARGAREDDHSAVLDEIDRRADALLPMGAPSLEPAVTQGVMNADPRSLAGIPPYPGAVPRSLGPVTDVMGIPLIASWFTTRDGPEAVLDFYEAAYRDAGIMVATHLFSPQQGYIAWLEEDPADAGLLEGVMHMVSVIKNAPTDHDTIVLLSASRPQRLFGAQRSLPPGVVLPEGAGTPQLVELQVEGRRQVVITARVKGQLAVTMDQLRARLERDGWNVDEVLRSSDGRSLVARKPGASQSISAAARSSDELSLMVRIETEGSPQ